MTRLEPTAKIAGIVGAPRDLEKHLGRAVSAEQRVYILHSQSCVDSGIDLRECEYSIALDAGIDLGVWDEHQDVPVVLGISEEYGDLEPAPVEATTPTNRSE
ncbi:hypothetical protein [Microbacterium allomyrinae]|uniref:Uncharacterized protein n=1 Tax=Microbacterium allomyrinae TaxID=2830666 RepID=A0A9X1S3B6_9MICO|nr:hypothetical protein [Microbacterium allomyrinae]MCC2031815.1 hypothetical protein [Microbacterium allomyrinae]